MMNILYIFYIGLRIGLCAPPYPIYKPVSRTIHAKINVAKNLQHKKILFRHL